MNPFLVTRIPVLLVSPVGGMRLRTTAAFCVAFFATAGSGFAQSSAQAPSRAPDPAPTQISAPAQDPLIARVGDVEIRESDVRLADEAIGKDIPPLEGANRREYLITFLSDMIRLSKAAQERNVGNEAEIKRRVEFVRSKTLMDELLEVTGRNAATEEAVRKTFDLYLAKNPPQPELHLRYLLFKFADPDDKTAVDAAEARAKEAIKLIAGGEQFRAVAVKMSDDPGAKIDSGDLGYMTRTQMGKDYSDVAFKLRKGEVSAPIKTAIGWHVITVEDERERKPLDFDHMRDSLTTYVSRSAQLQLLAQLRRAAPLERLDQTPPTAEPAKPGN